MADKHYDVIIIGGRCAGASLAIRLAGTGLKILLLDRASFPSLPNVPSAPFVHAAAMRLLDEMGVPESEYSHAGSKIERFVVELVGHFHTSMECSQMNIDRNYLRGIDRKLFDNTLWNHAEGGEGVTTRDNFAVSQILKDETGKVTGIADEDERFSADLVVGADGRFSFAARQFGAKTLEERNKYTTAVYHAEWENVEDYSAEYPNALSSYRAGNGVLVLVIPIAERKYHIGISMRSADANFGAKGFEQAYHERIQAIPHLANRLNNAQCIGDVVGMRPIENGYREAFGENWALVGDAVHYKDPTDGQGIYDALLEAKLLAQAIIDWKKQGKTWAEAGSAYQEQMKAATYPTFKQTVENIKQTSYTEIPTFLINSLVRWMLTDPKFQRDFLRYISRDIKAEEYKPGVSPKVLIDGFMADRRK
jgi:flavin-dependent dehydrogenase